MITGLVLLGASALPAACKVAALVAATVIAVPMGITVWLFFSVLTTPKRWR